MFLMYATNNIIIINVCVCIMEYYIYYIIYKSIYNYIIGKCICNANSTPINKNINQNHTFVYYCIAKLSAVDVNPPETVIFYTKAHNC